MAGRKIEIATSVIDVGRTALDALGLTPPVSFQGADLAALAGGGALPGQRPLAATRADRFSIRWGTYVLLGAHEREVRMCDLALDPACIADVRGTSALALEPMRRFALEALASGAAAAAPRRRTRPTLDEHTKAALRRWGHLGGE
jgi:hypothetical protein